MLSLCVLGADAFGSPNGNAESELTDSIKNILGDIDFGKFEELINGLDDDLGLMNGGFFARVEQLLASGYADTDQLWQGLLKLLLADALKLLPLFAIVVAIAVAGNMLQGLNTRAETSNVIYYACFSGILVSITVVVAAVLKASQSSIGAMQKQMEVAFPVLLTLITALGGSSTVAVYQPLMALLSQGIAALMSYCVLPMFLVGFVLQIISSLNPRIKLDKLSELFSSLAKWLIGIVFTVFSAFLSVQGIYAGIHDGVSFRTAKYAISHYIPIVGGYLSDGLNMILAGSMLIKNSIGVASVLLLVVTILGPVLAIVGLKIVLMLCGAVLEPLQDGGYAKFCTSLSKSLNLLLAVVLSVAFMYFISLVLMICSANYVVN